MQRLSSRSGQPQPARRSWSSSPTVPIATSAASSLPELVDRGFAGRDLQLVPSRSSMSGTPTSKVPAPGWSACRRAVLGRRAPSHHPSDAPVVPRTRSRDHSNGTATTTTIAADKMAPLPAGACHLGVCGLGQSICQCRIICGGDSAGMGFVFLATLRSDHKWFDHEVQQCDRQRDRRPDEYPANSAIASHMCSSHVRFARGASAGVLVARGQTKAIILPIML